MQLTFTYLAEKMKLMKGNVYMAHLKIKTVSSGRNELDYRRAQCQGLGHAARS